MQTLTTDALQLDIQELDKFIEPETEIPKTEVIHRFAGIISYQLLTKLKLIIFHSLRKDSKGNLSLL
jgi:hypothetical protein